MNVKDVDVAKYPLNLFKQDDTYTRYHIDGLKMAYFKTWWNKEEKLESFGGCGGLLKVPEYPGFCVLCMTYHTPASHDFGTPGYIVEFSPLYNEDGEVILVEYDHDDVTVFIDRGYDFNYKNEHYDAEICFLNHGGTVDFEDKEL